MEVTETTTGWKRSKRSDGANNCVEIMSGLIAVRDSKNPATMLPIDARTLIAEARRGRLDR